MLGQSHPIIEGPPAEGSLSASQSPVTEAPCGLHSPRPHAVSTSPGSWQEGADLESEQEQVVSLGLRCQNNFPIALRLL